MGNGETGSLEAELWYGRWLHFWHQVELAAFTQEEYAPGLAAIDPKRDDTLTRVRVRPRGRAVSDRLRRRPDDELEDLYDPDTVTRRFYYPSEQMAYLRSVPVRQGGEWCDPPGHHTLQIPYPGARGIECEQIVVRSAQQLKDLSETGFYRRARFAEATGDWLRSAPSAADYRRCVESNGRLREEWFESSRAYMKESALRENSYFDRAITDAPGGRDPMAAIDTEFIPIVGGSANRQLYTYAHWEQTAKAFEMRHHSELATAAVNINTDFTLGRGITWKIGNIRVKDIWQEFWDRNKMSYRLRVLMDDFTWQGELLIRKYELAPGFLEIRSMDPGVFQEIVTAPEDVESVFYYSQTSPTPWQLITAGLRGQQMNVPGYQYIIRQYPASEIFHLKNNVSATEKWGRSDFYAALGTLKRHRDWTNAATLRDMLQCNLVWRITVKGDQADVDAFVADTSNVLLPAPGGAYVQNEAVTLEPMHEDVASGGGGRNAGNTGTFLTALFATSQNMPMAYFNGSPGGSARAVALTQGEPFAKKIATRQQQLRVLLDHLYEEVMRAAVKAGRVDPIAVRSADAVPEWVFPAPDEEDRGAKFRDLKLARELMVFSHRTLSTAMAKELGNEEYDYDKEQADIDDERTEEGLATWPLDTEVAVQLGQQPAGAEPPPGLGGLPGAVPPQLAAGGGPVQNGQKQTSPETLPLQTSRNEQIAGPQATRDFKLQQRNKESLSALNRADRRFLEAAMSGLTAGDRVILPSGRVAVIHGDQGQHPAGQ